MVIYSCGLGIIFWFFKVWQNTLAFYEEHYILFSCNCPHPVPQTPLIYIHIKGKKLQKSLFHLWTNIATPFDSEYMYFIKFRLVVMIFFFSHWALFWNLTYQDNHFRFLQPLLTNANTLGYHTTSFLLPYHKINIIEWN